MSSRIAWTVCAIAVAIAAGLGLLLLNQRRTNDAERVRLEEARQALEREQQRAQALTDQMTSLQSQIAALDDRLSGVEQANRDLQRRLSVARRPARTEVAMLPSGPVGPDLALDDVMPIVELHLPGLAGEPSPPLTALNLSPASEWPIAERLVIPRAAHPLADPALMKRMYIGYGALQAADITSTIIGLRRGGYEANPFMRGIANRPAALIGVKVGVSVATVAMLEKLRKDKPVTAAITLAALNSTLAVVAVNNAKASAKPRKP